MDKTQDKTKGKPVEEDFSTSMARLAELAAQGISDQKPKHDGEDDDDIMKEFLTPKKKTKQVKTWSQRLVGKTIKVRINPYVASGILVILISIGVIAAPRIAKLLEERSAEIERKRVEAIRIAKQTDNKLRKYTIFDAVKDSGNGKELKSTSIAELALKVQEDQIRSESRGKRGGMLNLLNDGEIAQVSFSMEENDLPMLTNDSDDFITGDFADDSDSSIISSLFDDPNSWQKRDVSDNLFAEFKFESACQPALEAIESLNTELFYVDILNSLNVPSNESTLCRG